MPSFVHTILVHRLFVPLHFVHAIFCPNNFSPKILCPFNLCLPSFFSKHSWYFNILVDDTFCLIDIYSPTILCPISFFYGAVLSQAHVSILVSLCPASSYFRNSFTKPLNSHVLIICPTSQYSPHHHRPSAHTEHTIQSWSNRCYYNHVGTSMTSANILWPYLHRLSCLVIS